MCKETLSTRKQLTNEHESQYVPIMWAEVDKDMIPLVRFMNKFRGITTLHSCRGDNPDGHDAYHGLQNPYVVFHCDTLGDFAGLVEGMHIVMGNGWIHFTSNYHSGGIRFALQGPGGYKTLPYINERIEKFEYE